MNTTAARDYDAIVVGAGPAGASAALTLLRGGARVALLDRERFPRDKACGDLLGRAAVRECLALGIDPLRLGAYPARGVVLHSPAGAIVHGRAYRGAAAAREACLVPRLHFDAALVDRAVTSGAELHCLQVSGPLLDARGMVGGVVTRRDGEPGPTLTAPLVIGADGWGSALARALLGRHAARPAQKGIAIRGYMEGVRGLYGRLRFFHERDLLPGCAWIFPLGASRANVGLGMLVRNDNASVMPLAERFSRLLADPDSPAAPFLRDASLAGAPRTWPLALGWRGGRVAFDGALLAGDAAALVSPLSGSGIAAALRSGRLAGEVGLRALKQNDCSYRLLSQYEDMLRRTFRWRYALEHAGQRLIAGPARLDWLATAGMRMPYSQAVAANLLFNLG